MGEQVVFAVDSHDSGVTIGRVPRGDFSVPALVLRAQLSLTSQLSLRRRYAYQRENPLWELESELMKLSRQGILGRALIVFGVESDPFFPFEGRFDCSMKALALFERYRPAKLVIQTRSPLIVLNLPVLRKMGDSVSVTIPVESCDEAVIAKYLPEVPSLPERLSAMQTLRNMKVHVTAQAFPILPFGDWHNPTAFAEMLSLSADSIIIAPLISDMELRQKRVKKTALLEALAKDRQFRYMRPDSDVSLRTKLQECNPAILKSPYDSVSRSRQLGWDEILTA